MAKITKMKRNAGLALLQMKTSAALMGQVRSMLKSLPKARLREALASDEGIETLGAELSRHLAEKGHTIPVESFVDALRHQRKKAMKAKSRRIKFLGRSAA